MQELGKLKSKCLSLCSLSQILLFDFLSTVEFSRYICTFITLIINDFDHPKSYIWGLSELTFYFKSMQ